jgi:hypothetical protein
MSKLYELTGYLKELEKEFDEVDFKELEDGDFDPQALRDTLEAVEGEFNEKAVAIIKFSENLSGDVSVIDAEIKRLQARKAAIQNKQKSMREYLLYNMQASGITKISCPLFTASIRKGVERVIIDDENKIPDNFVSVEVVTKVDKNSLKRELKAGTEIPGARIERGDDTIVIR